MTTLNDRISRFLRAKCTGNQREVAACAIRTIREGEGEVRVIGVVPVIEGVEVTTVHGDKHLFGGHVAQKILDAPQ